MRTIKINSEGDPLEQLSKFDGSVDWKANPDEVLTEVDSQLKAIGLEVVKANSGDDSCIWRIEKIVYPDTVIVLGYTLRKMTKEDYMGFAGAEDDSYIGETADAVLIWDPREKVLSEIPGGDVSRDKFIQRDWKATEVG